jgi:transposase-like protein
VPERILNTKLDEHLEAENADGQTNHRNGYSKKSVLTATSKMTLAVPNRDIIADQTADYLIPMLTRLISH